MKKAVALALTLTAASVALAEQIDRPEYLVPLSLGQWQFYWVRAEHKLALSFRASPIFSICSANGLPS